MREHDLNAIGSGVDHKRLYMGDWERTFLIGKTSSAHQTVDSVTVTGGSAPGPGAVLSDVQNAAYGHGVGGAGQAVRLRAENGRIVSLRISGEARNLNGAQLIASDGIPVPYTTAQTIAALSGTPGYTQLTFRLHDHSEAAARRTVTTIRSYLQTVPGFNGFSDLPEIRSPGDWPGKSGFDNLAQVSLVVTLLGALVLLSSMISTLIGEQTQEISPEDPSYGCRDSRRYHGRTSSPRDRAITATPSSQVAHSAGSRGRKSRGGSSPPATSERTRPDSPVRTILMNEHPFRATAIHVNEALSPSAIARGLLLPSVAVG